MEKETEENTTEYENENVLLKQIESNFKLIKRKAPSDIEDEIEELYNQFITVTKGEEKDKVFEKIDILNTIINKTSETIKNSKRSKSKELKNYINEIIRSMYKINSIKNIPSHITKVYKNGKYIGDYLNGRREGKGIYKYNNGDRYEGEYKNDLKEGKGVYK